MKLYEIADAIEQILAKEVDEYGQITDEAWERLDALEHRKGEVILDIARYAKGERAEAEAIELESKRLKARAGTHTARATSLENYIAKHLVDGELKDANTVVNWKESSAVGVTPVAPGEPAEGQYLKQLVDPEYVKESLVYSVDKASALKKLRAGEKIKGLFLEKRSKLVIK